MVGKARVGGRYAGGGAPCRVRSKDAINGRNTG